MNADYTLEKDIWGFSAVDLYEGIDLQFLRVKDRTWRRVAFIDYEEGRKALLLNGWFLRSFRAMGKPPEYMIVRNSEVKQIPANLVDTLLSKQSFPKKRVKVFTEASLYYLDISETWLPNQLLSRLISISSSGGIIRTRDNKRSFLQFHIVDWPIAEQEILGYGLVSDYVTLRTEDSSKEGSEKYEVPSELVSNILDKSYSDYFKKEDRIHFFTTELAFTEDESNLSEEVKPLFSDLLKRSQSNPIAARSVTFLRGHSSTMVDWKLLTELNLPSSISGLVLSVGDKSFANNYVGNYFRLFAPSFGYVLHLFTTVAPESGKISRSNPVETFRNLITLSKWRAYPYIGKLRNTGKSADFQVTNVAESVQKDLLWHLSGFPLLERLITELGHFNSFAIDGQTWTHGHHPFTRTFLAAFEVMSNLDRNSPLPAMHVKDILGMPYRLVLDYKDFERRRFFLSGLKKGTWITLLVSFSPNQAKGTETDPFEFYVQPYSRIESISSNEASIVSALGILREFGSLSDNSTTLLNSIWQRETNLFEAFEVLKKRGAAVSSENFTYYVPWRVVPDDVLKYTKLIAGEKVQGYMDFIHSSSFAIMSMMVRAVDQTHPLFYLKFALEDIFENSESFDYDPHTEKILHQIMSTECSSHRFSWNNAKLKHGHLADSTELMTVSRDTDPEKAFKFVIWKLKKKGNLIIKAAGTVIPTVYKLLDKVYVSLSYLYPRSNVQAKWLLSGEGYKVRSVTIFITTLEAKYYG